MLSSVLLVLVLVSGVQASHYGVVFTYSVGDLQMGGHSLTYDYKMSFSSCEILCHANCIWPPFYAVDESNSEWCQTGYVWNYAVNTQYLTTLEYMQDYSNWINNRNGIGVSRIALFIDLRNRSDINQPNSSPQTTILPLVRVPSNCQRNISLLSSDPDGDEVRCRYAVDSECHTCTPPSVLRVSSSCTLSFSPTNSNAEGSYVVQLMMEDFPTQTITLTNSSSSQEEKNTNTAISKIPVQFVFQVDPAAPSCSEGLYLPRFLPPTPENGAQISTNVSQTVKINIRAEATQAMISELLFSGPHGVVKSSSGSGNFTLTWIPSDSDGGLTYALCFVVQAKSSSSVYQSDLRCIILTTSNGTVPISHLLSNHLPPPTLAVFVQLNTTTSTPVITTLTTTTSTPTMKTTTTPPASTIPSSTLDPGPYYVLALNAKISTSLSLQHDYATIITLIKEELNRRGLPSDIILKILSNSKGITTTT